ncbi:ribosomal protein L15 [Plasmodium vivax India VII]|uniref:Ribosomal protein L15, mitochondrial, putative n=4 Tax=Plasmodium vivax TaxID=5855 RepID=A0A1G4H373_PLAVI|nr:ribosomal protein L15 [Plasmodium vivax India VII]KMZ83741.1 ribosomal protein L15 [Plasmodium vivax Brazil I]KMZ90942.1 ribosomal protein L15 [Plasmodium vivax Mauritania I]CAI7722851.1 ribosomal protein L15, mitochondrial, putative [Plasmodium vivax]SCO69309.1 ribosomal protein L15, putative [Plasmodium vivax]
MISCCRAVGGLALRRWLLVGPAPACKWHIRAAGVARGVANWAGTNGAAARGALNQRDDHLDRLDADVSPKVGKHFREAFHDGSEKNFECHPFNRRFAYSKRSFFPIEPRNLRTLGVNRQRKKKRGRGDKCPGKGIREKHKHRKSGRPNSRTFESGRTPLYRRLPKWPEAWLSRQKKNYDCLNISKLRYFIEKGRLDVRFPITQRHLHDCRCVKVKNGVKLFNVNDYPFPYKIHIEVASADQSSIDVIKKVGGTVTIVYMERINLRAHVKPFKFEVLPRTARPNLDMIHFLEKMRSRGCLVKYIKPLWLIEEEKRIINEMTEVEESSKLCPEGEQQEGGDEEEQQRRERLLQGYRLQNASGGDQRVAVG